MCMWICGRNKEETLLKLFPAIDKRMIILRFLSQVWRNTNAYTKANDLSAVIDAGNLSLKNPRSPNTEWRTKLGNSRCQLFRDLITLPMRPPHWHSRGCGIQFIFMVRGSQYLQSLRNKRISSYRSDGSDQTAGDHSIFALRVMVVVYSVYSHQMM